MNTAKAAVIASFVTSPTGQELKHTVKSILLLMSFMITSGAVGSSIMAKINMHSRGPSNSAGEVALAAQAQTHTSPVSQQIQVDSSVLATQGAELNHTTATGAENSVMIRDLSDKQTALKLQEALDFDKISSRLDVDESKVTTTVTVFGTLLTTGMGILLFFHFDDRFKQKKLAIDRHNRRNKLQEAQDDVHLRS